MDAPATCVVPEEVLIVTWIYVGAVVLVLLVGVIAGIAGAKEQRRGGGS